MPIGIKKGYPDKSVPFHALSKHLLVCLSPYCTVHMTCDLSYDKDQYFCTQPVKCRWWGLGESGRTVSKVNTGKSHLIRKQNAKSEGNSWTASAPTHYSFYLTLSLKNHGELWGDKCGPSWELLRSSDLQKLTCIKGTQLCKKCIMLW